MVMPTTRWPCSTSMAAASALSTPPDRAATTSTSPGAGMSRGNIAWYMPGTTMERNRCEVGATGLDEVGLGVGPVDDEGRRIEVHVANLLPGERAEVALEHQSPHKPIAWGRVVRR